MKIFVIIVLLTLISSSCNQEKNGRPINICIYGSYDVGTNISVEFNDDKVYEQIMETSRFEERRLPAIYSRSNQIRIRFTVGKKDTTFKYVVKKYNYLNMAYASHHNQFQVSEVDSLDYQKSGDDVIFH